MTNQEALRNIDLLEAVRSLQYAICDVENVEWGKGETQEVDLHISARDDHQAISFALGIEPETLLVGLRAMLEHTERQVGMPQQEQRRIQPETQGA